MYKEALEKLSNIQESDETNYKLVTVRHDYVVNTDKAIGLTIERRDGVVLPNKVYFPKSQCIIRESGTYVTIKIPMWLWNSKLPYGEQIFTGM